MDPNFIADKLPMNPIDYYDNDDGFWDEYIIKKWEKYSKVPLNHNRRYYIH